MAPLKKWAGIGLAAVTFILFFKFVAAKTNVKALTSVAGSV
jgi:hypothetical protein